MKQDQILSLLEQYHPADAEEKNYRAAMIAFAQKYTDCFERSLEIGHFTASSWLVDKDNTHALLMHHTKLDRWFQLGGHCDGESDVLAVALKEAQEESGITAIAAVHDNIFDIDVHVIPEFKGIPEHIHYDVRFLLQVTSDEAIVQNSESKELRWISKNPVDLPTPERSVTRMFEKWIQQ